MCFPKDKKIACAPISRIELFQRFNDMFDKWLRLFNGDSRDYAPMGLILFPLRSSEKVYNLAKFDNGISNVYAPRSRIWLFQRKRERVDILGVLVKGIKSDLAPRSMI